MIEFTEYFQLINQPQEIITNCNSITIINTGNVNAILDGLTVTPGNQYISTGNANEINRSRYRISFAAPGNQEVIIIRKIYKNA